MTRQTVAIVGGGAAGLACACFLDPAFYQVSIYEKNKALGRKLLVAGKGGFNLTHSEDINTLVGRYSPPQFLDQCLRQFDNEALRGWLRSIGVETYIGSSRRVFPKEGIKPIEVVKKIEAACRVRNVEINTSYEWQGEQLADIMIFALGGASWSVTGSDGKWASHFANTKEFLPSNCAFHVAWPPHIVPAIEGRPLKNVVVSCAGKASAGEIMLTKFGLEGGSIYALSEAIMEQLKEINVAHIHVDLKKDLSKSQIVQKLSNTKEKTISNSIKRDLKLPKHALVLLKEFVPKQDFLDPASLSHHIKNFSLSLSRSASLDEAISSTGGIPSSQIDQDFALLNRDDQYVIGEMIDWNAPTGGYLLQASFSMGYFLANKLNAKHL